MRNILVIIKKELKRFFTDRRMLISLFLPGIILYLMYSLMGNFIGGAFSADEEHVYTISINVEEDITKSVFSALEQTGEIAFEKQVIADNEQARKKLEEGELDLVISYSKVEGALPNYELYYNSTSPESTAIYSVFNSVLLQLSSTPIFHVLPTDIATEEDVSMMMINMLLPFLLLTFLFSGCMAVATESIAGEKERGTIATLLITPIKRSHIALAKVCALSITALASATVSFISVMLSLPKLMNGSSGGQLEVVFSYGAVEYLSIFVVIIMTVLLFTVILSLVSAIAKSIKEATSYAMPVMILIMIIGISGMLGAESSSPLTCLIPIYNTVQCLGMIFSQTFNPICLLLTVVSNAVMIACGVFALAKLFQSERVMFNK